MIYIVIVGTSLFRNIFYYLANHKENENVQSSLKSLIKVKGIYKQATDSNYVNPIKLARYIEDQANRFQEEKQCLISEFFEMLRNGTDSQSSELSAELNSIESLKTQVRSLDQFPNGTGFDFIHSDTLVGEICAKALKRYIEESEGDMINARTTRVNGLTSRASTMEGNGLYNFAKLLFEKFHLYLSKKKEIEIIATGGFKAQIPYTSLLSIVFQKPVYYYHNLFERLIELPNIPVVAVDTSAIHQNLELFHNLYPNNELQKEEVIEDWSQKTDQNLISLFLDENNDHYELNKVGSLFFEFFQTPGNRENTINIEAMKDISGEYFFEGKVEHLDKKESYLFFTVGTSLIGQAMGH